MDLAEIQKKMKETFCVEAADLLAELDTSMLELESRPQDADLLNRVFRALHTLKGSGGTAGFIEMAGFAHHFEELFDEARMGQLTITPEMIDLALHAKDLIGQLLEPSRPALLEQSCAQVVAALAKFLPHLASNGSKDLAKTGGVGATLQRYKIFFKPHAQVFFSGSDPVTLVDELSALGKIIVTARVEGIPPLDSMNPEQCYLAWEVNLRTPEPLAKIKDVFVFVEDESEIRIESQPDAANVDEPEGSPQAAFLNLAGQSLEAIGAFLSQLRRATEPDLACCKNYRRILKTFQAAASQQAQDDLAGLLEEQLHLLALTIESKGRLSDQTKESLAIGHQQLTILVESLRENNRGQTQPVLPAAVAPPPPTAVPEEAKKEAARVPATIRVDQEKLDRLMRSAGELLVARNAFPVLAKKIALEHGLSVVSKEVKDAGDHISRIADDLQAAVLSIRMMPVRTVFQRFPRMVRDICRIQNKETDLQLEGEDTELDKTVVEQIADPLVHLVRNAVDHGIESPEIRAQAGKPRAGKLTLRAYNKANNVVIEVQDDGRGMDPLRLKKKALEKGLITLAAAESMDDRAALELIFLPGFTTAEKLTDISGRGVGMDVVRSNIQQLRGTTTLESKLGGGSKITITLPASLMVSKGVLVESKGEEYVFPIESVARMLLLPRQQIHRHEQTYLASYRDEIYPVVRLANHFGAPEPFAEVSWPEEVAMAIVQTNRGKIGVAVDRFLGRVEMIVKPMSPEFANLSAFQGTTIMGDGRIALVINPAGLI